MTHSPNVERLIQYRYERELADRVEDQARVIRILQERSRKQDEAIADLAKKVDRLESRVRRLEF